MFSFLVLSSTHRLYSIICTPINRLFSRITKRMLIETFQKQTWLGFYRVVAISVFLYRYEYQTLTKEQIKRMEKAKTSFLSGQRVENDGSLQTPWSSHPWAADSRLDIQDILTTCNINSLNGKPSNSTCNKTDNCWSQLRDYKLWGSLLCWQKLAF
jgi:hypothetical protein